MVCMANVVAVVCPAVVWGFSSLVTSLPLVIVGFPVVIRARSRYLTCAWLSSNSRKGSP